MAKTPADKQQAYTAKTKAQDNENYIQEECLRKKNRLLKHEKRKLEKSMKSIWNRREKEKKKERQENKIKYEYSSNFQVFLY